jgi:linoleoyl-CoA desaturase
MENLKIKFNKTKDPDFITELREEVNNYFTKNHISPHANAAMVLKTITILAITFGSYALILTNWFAPWQMLLLAIIMGLGVAGIGFSIQHDANHGAYSSNPTINKILGLTLNLIGGNAFTWKVQHNILHHTYTNIYSLDEDLDAGIIVRLSPNAPLRKFHKYQQYFAFAAYSLVTLSWFLIKDFKKIKRYHGGVNEGYQKPVPASEYVILILSKIIYIGYAIVIPLLVLNIHWWQFLIGFLCMHFTTGVVLSVVFQLAHVVEGPEQPMPDENGLIDNAWAIHQMRTTANFAKNNKLLCWYVGGLNFQIEHHIFPKVCSIHYPKISPIVKSVALRHGVPYHEQKTLLDAIKSHYHFLKILGNPIVTAS